MNQSQYIFCCLFRTVSPNFEELDYEIQYDVALKLYSEFEYSKFNLNDKEEYECMLEYLLDLMSRLSYKTIDIKGLDLEQFRPSLN